MDNRLRKLTLLFLALVLIIDAVGADYLYWYQQLDTQQNTCTVLSTGSSLLLTIHDLKFFVLFPYGIKTVQVIVVVSSGASMSCDGGS